MDSTELSKYLESMLKDTKWESRTYEIINTIDVVMHSEYFMNYKESLAKRIDEYTKQKHCLTALLAFRENDAELTLRRKKQMDGIPIDWLEIDHKPILDIIRDALEAKAEYYMNHWIDEHHMTLMHDEMLFRRAQNGEPIHNDNDEADEEACREYRKITFQIMRDMGYYEMSDERIKEHLSIIDYNLTHKGRPSYSPAVSKILELFIDANNNTEYRMVFDILDHLNLIDGKIKESLLSKSNTNNTARYIKNLLNSYKKGSPNWIWRWDINTP